MENLLKRFLTTALVSGLLLAGAGPALATVPTEKATNVQISAAGMASGELRVSWTVPNSFDGDFAGYVVLIKDNDGIEVERSNPLIGESTDSYIFNGLVNGQAYSAEVITNYDGPDDLVTTGNGTATPYAAPDAPAKPTVSRTGSGQILVDWDVPVNNGNAISSYTISCIPACSNATITSTSSEKTIAGLVTSTSYTVSVVATNERGNSVSSVSSNAIVPHADVVPPSNLVITPGDSQVATSWTAPAISGATISSYTVQLFLETAPTNYLVSRSVTSPSATFTGLNNGARYFFKVFTVVGSITSSPATSIYGLTAATVVPPPSNPSNPSNPSTPNTSNTPSTPVVAQKPVTKTPAMKLKQKLSSAVLAKQIKMTVPAKAVVTLTVAKSSKAVCKVVSGKLIALKKGKCSVTVAVTPAKTKAVKKPKTTKKSTIVVIS